MTTRTRDRIVCECGHEGSLVCSENDAPFSGLWERYSLDGFAGGHLSITSYADMPDNLLVALAPTCPKCGQTNKVRYAE